MKALVGVARFPFGNQECPDSVDWLVESVVKLKSDKRVTGVRKYRVDDTPISMGRNRVLKQAAADGVDLLLMLDSDMAPDLYVGADKEAKPFLDVALDHCFAHEGPCVIAAPYCGPPPHENVFVFRPGKKQSDHPNVDFKVEQYTREEAVALKGVHEVMALPTGLMLIDMRCVPLLNEPYFDYEYEGDAAGEDCPHCKRNLKPKGPQSEKSTTEDVYFSRNLALAGVKQYCAWDSWAGHWKRKRVGKPTLLTVDAVREEYRDAVARGCDSRERLVDIKSKKVKP